MARLFGIGTFYGETESFSIADATLSEVWHERAATIPPHSHKAGHFCLLLEGTYVEHSGAITIAYKPLTVAFLPPEVPHADTIGEGGCRFFIVELEQRWMDAIRSYGVIISPSCTAAMPRGSVCVYTTNTATAGRRRRSSSSRSCTNSARIFPACKTTTPPSRPGCATYSPQFSSALRIAWSLPRSRPT